MQFVVIFWECNIVLLRFQRVIYCFELIVIGGFDEVQNVWCIVQNGVCVVGVQFYIGVIDVWELMQIFSFDVCFCVINGVSIVFYSNYFFVEIFYVFYIVIVSFYYY